MSDKKPFTIVLFEPQIPQNTGNIVRTCKVAGAKLVLVKPLGFSISNAALKRAGLDYWDGVDVEVIDDLPTWLSNTTSPFYFFSSHSKTFYSDVKYPPGSIFIFGSETSGLSPSFQQRWPQQFLTLPMTKNSRCLNLSNTVSIVLYEAWKQTGFQGNKNEAL
jgi:tRNA (cytidine/uridine-2'-O-)-methyltransferase